MRRLITMVLAMSISSIVYAQGIEIKTGWQNIGATEDLNVSMAKGEIGTGGQLSITDPDAGEAKFDSNAHGGQYGY